MSRSGYDEDCEYATLNLYRANVDRAIAGRRGQAFLREMIAALDALPEKKLIAESFADTDGVCALGSVARVRGVTALREVPPPSEALLRVFEDQLQECQKLLARETEERPRALLFRLVGQWQKEIERMRKQLRK